MRTARGFTQTELSRRAGLSAASVGRYEVARVQPTPRAIAALARALEVETQHLERLVPSRTAASAVGQRLRQLRLERGLSQAQLAARVGCAEKMIRSCELGHKTRLAPDWVAIAAALGVSSEELARLAPPAPLRSDTSQFGRWLAQVRRLAGFSRPKLARRLGVATATVANYERGVAHPRPWVVPGLARALEIPPERLEEVQRPDPQAAELGLVVRRLREEHGLTRSQLGARLGWNRKAVRLCERGQGHLGPEQIPLAGSRLRDLPGRAGARARRCRPSEPRAAGLSSGAGRGGDLRSPPRQQALRSSPWRAPSAARPSWRTAEAGSTRAPARCARSRASRSAASG